MGVGQSARGIQGNAGERQVNIGSGYKVPGECSVMPRERKGVDAKSQGNAGECMGMHENARGSMGVGAKCQRNAWECKGMQGNARGT